MLPSRILLLDRPESAESLLAELALGYAQFQLFTAIELEEVVSILKKETIDLLVLNPELLKIHLETLIYQLGPRLSPAMIAILAMEDQLKAYLNIQKKLTLQLGLIVKPLTADKLKQFVINHLFIAPDQPATVSGCHQMVGSDPCMLELFTNIQRASKESFPILICGETGTGKELVARAIHHASPNRNRPFIPIDCGALTESLIESELFGHVRGAFTGAVSHKEGLFEAAEGGSAFLDEIGELPLVLQSRLLRVLQEHELRQVGSTRITRFTGRIIAATNRDLESSVKAGTFRSDLYFRLNIFPIQVPPLRNRREDIPLLVEHFLNKYSPMKGKRPSLSVGALNCLFDYHWPGNVRELENAIQRAIALSSGDVLYPSDFVPSLGFQCPPYDLTTEHSQAKPIRELERQAIFEALLAAKGDKKLAANLLGIGKTTLYRKLKAYGWLSNLRMSDIPMP